MGYPDVVTNEFLRQPKVFADVFNYYFFEGKEVVESASLKELDSAIKSEQLCNGVLTGVTGNRDIFRKAVVKTDGDSIWVALGVENQTRIDYSMVVRVMGYDYFYYKEMVENIINQKKDSLIAEGKGGYPVFLDAGDKIMPVYTLVVYFGTAPWTAPRQLSDLCVLPEDQRLRDMFANYSINVIEPSFMTEADWVKFRSQMGPLMMLIKGSKSKSELKRMIAANGILRELDSLTLRVFNAVTHSNLKIYSQNQEERVDMCKAIDEMMQDARAEGEAKGLAEGEAKGLAEGEAKGLAAGKAEGKAEGLAEGLAAGKAEGLAEGEAREHSRLVSYFVKESRRNHDDDASIRERLVRFLGLSDADALDALMQIQ